MDFKQAQEMMKLQQQAQKIQEELSNTHIEAEVDGLVVTVDWQLELISIDFEDKAILKDEEKLKQALIQAYKKANKKAKEVAAEKLSGTLKWLGQFM